MPAFHLIPSIDELLQRASLTHVIQQHGREAVKSAARRAADEVRSAMARGADAPVSAAAATQWIEDRIVDVLSADVSASLVRVINATGVIIHTNLGRTPLAASALDRAAAVGRGYSNLEYDLAAGTRGHRHVHAERLLCRLTGAEAAAVVNNNAAATLLVLATLAAGREVIVSRGELVEIGGGFRVPDVMAQSGATLREVGTTNRTRAADYAAAINDRTALVLRVHPSNFRIEGFTERPDLEELAALSERFALPLFEDLGSGWLGSDFCDVPALREEPSIAASLKAGVPLVAFSGDKLLGGPQCGLIVGRSTLIERLRRHPLMRAIRADKLTYAALEATLAAWSMEPERQTIPVYRMLTLSLRQLNARAEALAARLSDTHVQTEVIDGISTIGGGSAPGSALPTRLVALRVDGMTASELDARMRASMPAVVARIEHDRVVLDLRTMSDDEDAEVAALLRRMPRSEDSRH